MQFTPEIAELFLNELSLMKSLQAKFETIENSDGKFDNSGSGFKVVLVYTKDALFYSGFSHYYTDLKI